MKNLILKILEALLGLFNKKPENNENSPITGETETIVSGLTPITVENEAVNEEPEYTEIQNEDNYEDEDFEKMKILNIDIKRIFTNTKYTIGHLYIDGEYVCDTLEDADRGLDDSMSLEEIKAKKIHSKTAIPTGIYEVIMNVQSPKYSDFTRYKWAEKYDGKLPRLLDVKGFDGVLIHVGNSEEDSSGCLLVGLNKSKGCVCESTVTFNRLMDNYLLPATAQGRKIVINIFREYAEKAA